METFLFGKCMGRKRSVNHISVRRIYTAVDCRRPSLSCRRCPHLERPAAPRHVRIISACVPKPSEDALLPTFFSVNFCSVPSAYEVTLVIIDTLIIHFTYLLTYLLKVSF